MATPFFLSFKNRFFDLSNDFKVLTHLKEKLEHVTEQNVDLESELDRVENWSQTRRDELAKLKQHRDKLRTENIKLQQKMGLLGKSVSLWFFIIFRLREIFTIYKKF